MKYKLNFNRDTLTGPVLKTLLVATTIACKEEGAAVVTEEDINTSTYM